MSSARLIKDFDMAYVSGAQTGPQRVTPSDWLSALNIFLDVTTNAAYTNQAWNCPASMMRNITFRRNGDTLISCSGDDLALIQYYLRKVNPVNNQPLLLATTKQYADIELYFEALGMHSFKGQRIGPVAERFSALPGGVGENWDLSINWSACAAAPNILGTVGLVTAAQARVSRVPLWSDFPHDFTTRRILTKTDTIAAANAQYQIQLPNVNFYQFVMLRIWDNNAGVLTPYDISIAGVPAINTCSIYLSGNQYLMKGIVPFQYKSQNKYFTTMVDYAKQHIIAGPANVNEYDDYTKMPIGTLFLDLAGGDYENLFNARNMVNWGIELDIAAPINTSWIIETIYCTYDNIPAGLMSQPQDIGIANLSKVKTITAGQLRRQARRR